MKLSKRLRFVAQKLVDSQDSWDAFYDLCCDHGLLASKVYEELPQKSVYAIDRVPAIVEKISHMPFETQCLDLEHECLDLKLNSHLSLMGVGHHKAFDIISRLKERNSKIFFVHLISQGKIQDLFELYLNSSEFQTQDVYVFAERQQVYLYLFLSSKNQLDGEKLRFEKVLDLVRYESEYKELIFSYLEKQETYAKTQFKSLITRFREHLLSM